MNHFTSIEYCYYIRKLKTFSAKNDICDFPSWEKMSSVIKEKILPSIKEITEGKNENRKVVGVVHNPVELLKMHLTRFLEKQEMLGKPLPAGNYLAYSKTGDDGSRHGWFRWAEGKNILYLKKKKYELQVLIFQGLYRRVRLQHKLSTSLT